MEQTKGSPSVVAKAIRHHLEGDSVHAQKRALTIIEGLVEMGTPEFQRKFAEPTLVHAFQNTAENFGTDNGVRRKLMLMLLSWHRHFMRDPTMAHVSSLYGLCGGVDRVPVMPNQAKVIKPLHEHESTVDLLDDDSERVSVAGAISLASSESQALLQAMVNAREVHTNVLANEQVRVHVSNVLNSQKQLVRFIHTVNDEHYLGSLVQANDKIVDVLQRLQMVCILYGSYFYFRQRLVVPLLRTLSVQRRRTALTLSRRPHSALPPSQSRSRPFGRTSRVKWITP